MEEEQVRGKPTVVACAHWKVLSVGIPSSMLGLTEALLVAWFIFGCVHVCVSVSAWQLWKWQLNKQQSTDGVGKSRSVGGKLSTERTRP